MLYYRNIQTLGGSCLPLRYPPGVVAIRMSTCKIATYLRQDSFCKNASLRKVKEARKQKMSPRNITTQIHLNVDNINSGMGDYATEKN